VRTSRPPDSLSPEQRKKKKKKKKKKFDARMSFDRMAAEASLLRQTKRCIVTINKSGVIVSCNNSARILFGYPVGSMVGSNVSRLMPEPFASQHAHYVDRYLKTGRSYGALGTWKGKKERGEGCVFVII
jgi:PAS domain S-box-containing protein